MKSSIKLKAKFFFVLLIIGVTTPSVFGIQLPPLSPTKLPSSSSSGEFDQSCKIPTGKDRLPSHVIINANTGQILEGSTHFAAGEKVQIIVVNKNPFKYIYRIEIVSQPLEMATISGFFALHSGFDSVIQPTAIQQDAKSYNSPCENEVQQQISEALLTDASSLKESSETLAKILTMSDDYKKYFNNYQKFITDTETESIFIPPDITNCLDLCDRARTLVSDLSTLPPLDINSFQQKLKAFEENIGEIEKRADSLANGDCKEFTKRQLQTLLDPRKKW